MSVGLARGIFHRTRLTPPPPPSRMPAPRLSAARSSRRWEVAGYEKARDGEVQMRGKCGWCGAEAPADARAPRRGTAHASATLSHLRGRDLSHLRGRELSHLRGRDLIHLRGHRRGRDLSHLRGRDLIHLRGRYLRRLAGYARPITAYHVSAAALCLARRPERRRVRRGEPSRGSSAQLRGVPHLPANIYRPEYTGATERTQRGVPDPKTGRDARRARR